MRESKSKLFLEKFIESKTQGFLNYMREQEIWKLQDSRDYLSKRLKCRMEGWMNRRIGILEG
jgi:hypothetical protein